ncbi:MAG: hypothetical protein JWQ23_2531, partial [Herminiimonas sp.]|nr:hypothetical protein [Herminiimonas sp.]
ILFKRRGWYPEDRNCNIPYQGVVATEAEVDRVIDQVAKTFPKAIVVDPKQVMCNALECVTYIGNTALYKDANHINAKAAALLGKVYVSSHGNPFSGAVPDKLARTAAAGVK